MNLGAGSPEFLFRSVLPIPGKLIFKVRTGSHLYGLATEESDTDYLSVFIPHSSQLLGLYPVEFTDNSRKQQTGSIPGKGNIFQKSGKRAGKPAGSSHQRNTRDDIDDNSFSLSRFLKLLLRNNPNIVEVLFADPRNILVCESEFQELIDHHDKIISQLVRKTFAGYACSQKRKLVVKKERFTSLKKGLDYLEYHIFSRDTEKEGQAGQPGELSGKPASGQAGVDPPAGEIKVRGKKRADYREITEKEAAALNRILKYYKGKKQNCESFHKGMDAIMIYHKLQDEYEHYGWRVRTESFNKVGYDTKFAYHLIRLLFEGWQLLATGKLEYPLRDPVREQILKIRNQEVGYEELLDMYALWNEKILSVSSALPEYPDLEWADSYLIRVLKESIINEG